MNPEEEIDALFILGAGSSMGYNFPSGKELRTDIIKACELAIRQKGYAHDDEKHFEAMYLQNRYGIDKITEFSNTLKTADNNTIDDFLKHYSLLYGDITKECIALTLLLREKNIYKSNLHPIDKESVYKDLINKLYPYKESINNKKIKFVTFNYDISLDVYIQNTMKNKFNLTDHEEENFLRKMKIIHLHGMIVANEDGWKMGRKYGIFKLSEGLIRGCAESIKIISEVHKSDKEFEQAQDLIFRAKNIFFLGFGYDPENLDKLNFKEIISQKKTAHFHRTDYPTITGTILEHSDPEDLLYLEEYFDPFKFVPYNGDIISFLQSSPIFRNI